MTPEELVDHVVTEHLVRQRFADASSPTELAVWHDLDHRAVTHLHLHDCQALTTMGVRCPLPGDQNGWCSVHDPAGSMLPCPDGRDVVSLRLLAGGAS